MPSDSNLSRAGSPPVVVVDDGSQTRDTFQLAYPELTVVGTFAKVEALLVARPEAALVVLDLMLSTDLGDRGILQGPRAIEALVRIGYRVCLYTDERRLLVLAQCLAAGATGLARKSDPLSVNQAAFVRTAAGHVVVASSMVGLAELLNKRGRLPELTPRQAQVLKARARGEPWKILARRLGITPKTAYDRLEAVLDKMVIYLQDAGLDQDCSPADIERALGLAPGDLMGSA
jgi:DNA-binding NarL/FixJ family response regulator